MQVAIFKYENQGKTVSILTRMTSLFPAIFDPTHIKNELSKITPLRFALFLFLFFSSRNTGFGFISKFEKLLSWVDTNFHINNLNGRVN